MRPFSRWPRLYGARARDSTLEAAIPSSIPWTPHLGRSSWALLVALILAAPAAAQTADPIFAGFRWAPETAGSRPAGVGGAFTAIADGGKAVYVNPAGLALIPSWEVDLSSGERWVAVSGQARRHLTLSAYATKLGEQEVQPAGLDGAPSGSLASSEREAGLGFGAEPVRRVRIGATVAWSHLSLDGLRRAGDADEATTVAADSTHVRLTTGVLLTLVGSETRSFPTLRLGLSYQPGFDWTAQVADGNTGEPASPVAIRRPSLLTAGLAWRTADRWSFSAQGDFIRYHEVVDALRRNVGDRGDGFSLPDVVEPRLGAEFGAPLWCGCGVVKLRAGIHYQSPGTLRYVGDDPWALAAFTAGRWRTVYSLGGSFMTEHFGKAVRLDLDAKDLFDGPELSFGMAWRF